LPLARARLGAICGGCGATCAASGALVPTARFRRRRGWHPARTFPICHLPAGDDPAQCRGDSYWYHLPIAEQYVARGAIRPFAEGWYLGAYPQLATLLYTWAYQSPGKLFDHVALSSHLEWALFLATLAGVRRWRVACWRYPRPYAAAAVFLFPGIFLYDSSLITGADHVLAFFAPALGLALIRLGRRFEPREAVLAGILTAGPS